MQRGHLNGSYIMPEFCEVRCSATLARAQGHNFKGYLHWGRVLAVQGSECTFKWQTEKKPSSHSITDVFLTAFHSIPSSDSASEAPLYPESDHETTDPKTSLCSAAQQNTQTQSDPAKIFLLISSAVQRATHVPVLQCLTAIVIISLEPCIPTHQFVHQMLIFCGFRSLPSQSQVPDSLLRLCSEALFGAQRRVVLLLRGGFQVLLSGCTILPIISCSSVALSKCFQMVGQHRPTRVHTGRDAGSVFVWVMSKNPWHSSPCPPPPPRLRPSVVLASGAPGLDKWSWFFISMRNIFLRGCPH